MENLPPHQVKSNPIFLHATQPHTTNSLQTKMTKMEILASIYPNNLLQLERWVTYIVNHNFITR